MQIDNDNRVQLLSAAARGLPTAALPPAAGRPLGGRGSRRGALMCSHEERPEGEREEGTFRPSRAYYPVVQYSHNA